MKKILLLSLAIVALLIVCQSCKKSKYQQTQTIKVRGLFSLTGSWSTLGLNSKAAIELATADINAYLETKNANFRLSTSTADTKLDVELSKSLFVAAKNDGVRFIIGPQSSAELAALKPLVDVSAMLMISQSSTAGSLAIANDAIFRFCPSDKIEGAAMGATIWKAGIKGLVTVSRDDAGNKGLQTSTGAAFTAKGGELSAIAPYATTVTDFAATVAAIKAEVIKLSGIHGQANVAVYLASFDEGAEIFKLAAADPVLNNVKWYGGDGVVLSSVFTNNATVADFVVKTGFFAPSYGLSVAQEGQWKPIAARIKAKTNLDPDAFALVAYDAMWNIAYTLEATNGNTNNFTEVKNQFVIQANQKSGVVGLATLDAAGDRATGTFDYFGIVKEGTNYVWKLAGKSD